MPKKPHFEPELFKFLKQLKRHNNREWFQGHKSQYEQYVREPFLQLITDLQPALQKISPYFVVDPKPSGGSLLRIYKDLRFRPDAPPYQTMAAARFPHSSWKQTTAPGFYLHLEPARSFLGGGLWHPDPETRARIREAIVANPSKWKTATRSKPFTTVWELSGDFLKRLPPGFPENHQFAEDLRRKDFISAMMFSEDQVCSIDFLARLTTAFQVAASFMEFLTRALELPWASGDKKPTRDLSKIESFQLDG